MFRGDGVALLVWAGGLRRAGAQPAGRDAARRRRRDDSRARAQPIAWLLGAFYFLTFGGFVAFSIYLPTLLRTQFGLTPADAGFRAAGFVVLATLMRPRWRLAGRSDRRRAGALVGLRRHRGVLVAAGVAGDDAVHGRRARPARR